VEIKNISHAEAVSAFDDTLKIWYHWGPDELKELTAGGWIHFICECGLDQDTAMAPHIHEEFDEYYRIIAGTGILRIMDEQAEVGPGDVIRIPAKQVHSLSAEGREAPVHFHCVAVTIP
jgi:mannose-6-phosphate isomerase-like protein (cupin superfamily)